MNAHASLNPENLVRVTTRTGYDRWEREHYTMVFATYTRDGSSVERSAHFCAHNDGADYDKKAAQFASYVRAEPWGDVIAAVGR